MAIPIRERKSLPSLDVATVPKHRPLLPIGGLMDIPTGYYTKGLHGEMICNGGLPPVSGFAGTANTYKSTVSNGVKYAAMSRIHSSFPTKSIDHDSESSAVPQRQDFLAGRYKGFEGISVTDEGIVVLTDKTTHYGEQFFSVVKNFCRQKMAAKKDYMVELPFLDADGKRIMSMGSTLTLLDSLTEFKTKAETEIEDKNELGDSGRNMIHMRAGLIKAGMIAEIPRLANEGGHYFIMTSHIQRKAEISSGPFAPPPEMILNQLKHGDSLTGVSKKFSFLTQVLWQTLGAKPYLNQTTKAPEFPKDSYEDQTPSQDLNLIMLKALRNKHGPTGAVIPQLVSQRDGLLPELTEFYYIKENGRFGISGSDRNYHLDLLDSVSLSRTKVRNRLETNPKLARALNITAELRQMIEFMPDFRDLYCTPAELFEGVKSQGFDWDFILEGTRGWYTYFNDDHELKHLSTLDLLRMRKGIYKPYWLD